MHINTSADQTYQRQLFLAALQENIEKQKSTQYIYAVLILKVHNIELFDAIFEHQQIDSVLNQIQEEIKQLLRSDDCIFRIGDNKFGLLLPKLLNKEIIHLATNKILSAVRIPTEICEHQINLDGYVGATFLSDQVRKPGTYLQHINAALLEAINSNTPLIIYQPPHQLKTEAQHNMGTELICALDSFEFFMYYQPQLDLISGQPSSAEALIRWQNRKFGFVGPDVFIPLAEKNKIIAQLSQWVVENVFRYQTKLIQSDIDINISINLSIQDLLGKHFSAFLEQQLQTWGCPAEKIMLEITEGVMMEDPEKVLKTIKNCKDLGFKLSIDDFGTGYSSLSYLKDLPVDELKIDKSFVMDVLTNKHNEKIVRSVIDLAHNFDLKVVAEGIENKETLNFLKSIGCDVIQGYYLSRPLSEQDFTRWIKNSQTKS